jgi:competence protein ComEA
MPITARDALAISCAALAAMALGAAAFLVASGAFASEPATGEVSPAESSDAGPGVGLGAGTVASATPSTDLLVDVQGGVERPGLVRLPPGARVADAIAAAGGYSSLADLLSAATAVNLAAPLIDGQQVFVPLQGVASGAQPGTGGGTSGDPAGGLVNLNTASADALDALPGIGPVTVEKIVAARQEQPFATLDELVDRKVMNRGQLDAIRDLVTL